MPHLMVDIIDILLLCEDFFPFYFLFVLFVGAFQLVQAVVPLKGYFSEPLLS